jgi:molybdopterin/thiamine biosynthesis adenylyltransferase/rhodanese-related sulfurtransferase
MIPELTSRIESISLDPKEVARYSRHLIMPEVGMEGQKRLKAARVLLIGAGGLGSPLALYLAAAGVGRIGLVDFDVVDFSNLQRQVLHGTPDVGRPKLQSARERIAAINPGVHVDLYETRLTSANAISIIEPYDIIIDGTDNFPTRYLTNDACVLLGKPNVYGSIFRFDGQASVFHPPFGPCYRCLYPEPPPPGEVPSCAEGGVLGILPGLIGCIQATEAVKLILGKGTPLIGRLLLYDALEMRFQEFTVRRNKQCPLCGDNPTIRRLIDYEQFCGVRGREAQENAPASANAVSWEITVEELHARMKRGDELFILDVRNPPEFQICRLPSSLLIPLSDLPQRYHELDRRMEIIVHCKSGVRSARAVQFLRQQGFEKLKNLKGGILAWSDRIDPTIPKY